MQGNRWAGGFNVVLDFMICILVFEQWSGDVWVFTKDHFLLAGLRTHHDWTYCGQMHGYTAYCKVSCCIDESVFLDIDQKAEVVQKVNTYDKSGQLSDHKIPSKSATKTQVTKSLDGGLIDSLKKGWCLFPVSQG